jgi:Tfp pilus assembly protein FimT
LLELILVLILISVAWLVAAPSLRGFVHGRDAANAATHVLAMTQYARAQAIAQGRPFRLYVDSRENACWLTAQRAGVFTEVAAEVANRWTVPEGTSVQLVLMSEQTPTGSQGNGLQSTQLSSAMSGMFGHTSLGVRAGAMTDANTNQDYVEFLPDGRTHAATITLSSARDRIRVMCESATQRFRIVTGTEGAS